MAPVQWQNRNQLNTGDLSVENVRGRCQRQARFSLHPPSVTAKGENSKRHESLRREQHRSCRSRAAQSTRAPGPAQEPAPHGVPSSPVSYLPARPRGRRQHPAGRRTCCKNRETRPQKHSDTRGTPCFPATNPAVSFLEPRRERKGWGRKRNTNVNVKP